MIFGHVPRDVATNEAGAFYSYVNILVEANGGTLFYARVVKKPLKDPDFNSRNLFFSPYVGKMFPDKHY